MKRAIRVMHVIANLGGGGVERLLVKSLPIFDLETFSHRVCCVSKGGIYESDLQKQEIPYRILSRRRRFDPGVILQMARWMRAERIDVVHTYNFTANAWGRAAARLAGVPRIIAHERGTAWTESAAMRLVDRLLFPVTDILLANSMAAKTMLTHWVGLHPRRIQVVHNGMTRPEWSEQSSPSLRKRFDIPSDAILAGIIGRLDTSKGHSFLLPIIPLVWSTNPNIVFLLIGDGPLRPALTQQAAKLGILNDPRLRFLGFLTDAPNLMSELDMLVHPSIRESLGNVLIEAAFARLPAIASNVDGIPEVVVNEETGLLVNCTQSLEKSIPAPGASPIPKRVVDGTTGNLRPPLGPSPEELVQAILHLARDPDDRYRLGLNAQERANQYFTIERYVRQLENVYWGETTPPAERPG